MNKPVFSVEQPEDSPGFLLWQTTIIWQRAIKKELDSHGISHTQFVLLAILLWHNKIQQDPTQATLASWSKLDKMTVSKALKGLTDMDLVTKRGHKEDTRAKIVNLTESGKSLASKLVPVVEGIDKAFFSTLAQDKQTDLMATFKQLISEV